MNHLRWSIKSNSKYDRLFQKFCKEKDDNHIRLILYVEVRWLSKGICLELEIILEFFDTIIEFLNKENKCELVKKTKNEKNNIFCLDIQNIIRFICS